MRTNLGAGVHLGADPATAEQLSGAGFTAVTPLTGSGSQQASVGRTLDWFVSTASTRAAPGLSALSAAAVPIARFGTGSDSVEVGSVVRRPPAAIRALLFTDRGNRVLAGTGLAANPNLTVSPSFRALLRSGGLDLRAATFIAVLASSGSARVVAATENPAERAAARPVRTLTVAAQVADVQSTLASLPPAYQPMNITSRGKHTTLTWNPAVSPVAPIS